MKQAISYYARLAKKSSVLLFFALVPTLCYAQCPDDNHPHMIDLGLPSGTKWACCNVGADKPEAPGGYYAWGETEAKEDYKWETYKYKGDSYYGLREKYNNKANKPVLEPEDDVALVKWGNGWRMPTMAELKELIDNTNKQLKKGEENGLYGALLISKINGASIFMPFGGLFQDSSCRAKNDTGGYWLSSYADVDKQGVFAHKLVYGANWNSRTISMEPYSEKREWGLSVRPVHD